MYMIQNTWRARRGHAKDILADIQLSYQYHNDAGNLSNGKVYADMSGPFDIIVFQFEVESLDAFFKIQRGMYINPDANAQVHIDIMNDKTLEGRREIYEVIL